MTSDDQEFVVVSDKDVTDFNTESLLPCSPEDMQSIRQWLKPTEYKSDASEYKKHLASHAAGTGEWIRQDEQYQKWFHSPDHGALWIKAVAGAGKSVIAAQLASRLSENIKIPVLYFFFRQIITTNKTPQSLVRDWISQLLDFSPLLQSKLKAFLDARRGLESLAFGELWDIILMCMKNFPRVFCIVDALDEMDMGNDHFMQQLVELGRTAPASVKLLVTSRPLPRIESVFVDRSVLKVYLRPQTVDYDISIYVKARLDSAAVPGETKRAIEDALLNKSKGLFLYARLMMDDILEKSSNDLGTIDSLL
jgi:hypothetical protein